MDLERIRQERFLDNNSRVLRAINMLRTSYVLISDLEYGLGMVAKPSEIADSVNYLNEIDYIRLRNAENHTEVADLADAELNTLEAKLTAKGIAFLNGRIDDPCIRR